MQIFFPYAFDKTMRAASSAQRFVHYTGADTAMRILKNKEVWLRKSTCMNDFREIEHGFDCLRTAYKQNLEAFTQLFDGLFPNFTNRLQERFDGWLPHFRTDTYITCLSEHRANEDRIGRLSMWRAYGGDAGVALVLNPTAFLSPSDALGAYSSPVAYLTPQDFVVEFDRLLAGVRDQADFVRALGEEQTLASMTEAFRSAVLCTKHPGFHEEAEWRVIHSPRYQASERIRREIESVNGIPQPVCKIKLENIPEEGFVGAAIPELIERVIIGPARHPDVLSEAFVALLTEAGVVDASKRVFVSDIPLRR